MGKLESDIKLITLNSVEPHSKVGIDSITATKLPVEDWSNVVAVPICHKNEGYR